MKIANILVGLTLACAVVLGSIGLAGEGRSEGGGLESIIKAPEFPKLAADQWLNSEPLSLAGLRGKVVMVDFWTYGCWNCYRSFPWMNKMEARFEHEDFIIIGVHTPEFEREKDRAKVIEKIKEFELAHPVMMDNNYIYWGAMNNHFWPSYYLIDKKGFIRKHYVGETHDDTPRAKQIEEKIMQLLNESA